MEPASSVALRASGYNAQFALGLQAQVYLLVPLAAFGGYVKLPRTPDVSPGSFTFTGIPGKKSIYQDSRHFDDLLGMFRMAKSTDIGVKYPEFLGGWDLNPFYREPQYLQLFVIIK